MPRVSGGALVNSIQRVRVGIARLAARLCNPGTLVSRLEWARPRVAVLVRRLRNLGVLALVSFIEWVRVRLTPLAARLRTVERPSIHAARVRIDVVRKIKAVAMWTFAMIELGFLLALIIGAFLVYAATTKSALIS